MRLKRVVAAILCIVMTMSVLSGCVNTDSTNTESDSKVSSTETVVNDAKDNGEDSYVNEISDSNINLDANFVSGAEGVSPEQMQKDEKEDIVTALVSANNKKKEEIGTATENKQEDISEVPFDLAYPDVFNSSDVEYADNAILIKLKNTYSEKTAEGLKSAGIGKMEVMFELEGCKWYTAYLLKGTDVNTAMDAVREVSGVVLAEYNYKYETAVSGADAAEAEVCHNPKYHDQWPREKFGIKKAWGHYHNKHHTSGGSSAVTVAVIDTGVDYEHVDLKANMWKNIDEVANNGIDDDKNGYVDDYYGIDMTTKKGSGMDDNGHGTHVAGIIGASNNKEGMVGYAFNTKIMTVKAGDASGYFLQNNIAEAIIYAYDNGASVINMSFGGSACSIAVQDALAVAYTRCVLVASAGNDAEPNEVTDYDNTPTPNYPAALSYVLGVMSVDETMTESSFTNWDVALYNSVEYEVYAPGDQIISTLPGNRYGKLSGTSMAAPVVAAQAALLRSFYSDADTYPTKFIYGQIVGTAEDIVKCNNPEKHTVNGMLHNIPGVINFYDSMTELPTPDVGMSDYTVFDTETYVADTKGITEGYLDANNGDGVIDAGETIALGMTLKNRWGMSENTIVHIDATSEGGVEHPYVTFLNNDINYESVGTYSENDSGKLYSNDGEMWTGWEKPFYIHIDKDCPNDYTVTLNVTITCENALDEKDNTEYVTEEKILLKVRKGVILPNKISEDMTLTKENYYIIPNSMMVMEGATLTIEEGTKVQFWCSSPEDAYADEAIVYINVAGRLISKGTEEEPVEMFPSDWMSRYRVEIYTTGAGYASLEYTNVVNPYLTIDEAINCEFTQNNYDYLYYRNLSDGRIKIDSCATYVECNLVTECVFYKMGSYNYAHLALRLYKGYYKNCIFVDSAVSYHMDVLEGCVFYGNNNYWDSETKGQSSSLSLDIVDSEIEVKQIFRNERTGVTYITITEANGYIQNSSMISLAKQMGGTPLIFSNKEEIEFVCNSLRSQFLYTCSQTMFDGVLYNMDGTPIDAEYEHVDATNGDVQILGIKFNGNDEGDFDNCYVIEIPGLIYIENIELDEYVVNIDSEETYQINATLTPTTADENSLIYESQDESVVTVDANGKVTPVGAGTTSIRVYSPDYAIYNYVTINVVDAVPVESISIREGDVTMDVNTIMRLHVNYTPSYTTKKVVSYSSSNENVVTVDEKGNLIAVAEGNAVIMVIGHGGITATANVEVVIPVEGIAFKDTAYVTDLVKDDGTEFYPVVTPLNATYQDLIWESSDDDVCYVDEQGKLVKLQAGVVTLKATVKDTTYSSTIDVAVMKETISNHVVKIIRGEYYHRYYALTDEGVLWRWGKQVSTPVRVEISGVKDFMLDDSEFSDYLLILNENGTVDGYTCNPFNNILSSASPITGLQNIVSLSSGDVACDSYFAKDAEGNIWAWGNNNYGELGLGTKASVWSPTIVDVEADIDKVYGCANSTLFITKEGEVYFAGGTVRQYATPQFMVGDIQEIHDNSVDWFLKGREKNYKITNYGDLQNNDDLESKVHFGYYQWYIENGKVYVRDGSGNDYKFGYAFKELQGIENAVHVYDFKGNLFIRTEDDRMYAVGQGTEYKLGNSKTEDSGVPVRLVFGLAEIGNGFVLEGWNSTTDEDNNLVLASNKLILDYNQEIVINTSCSAYTSITLKDSDGNAVTFGKSMEFDKFTITPKTDLIDGETYTLTIPADALRSSSGELSTEAVITFMYQKNDTVSDETVDEEVTENEDITEEPETQPEVHTIVKNEEQYAKRHYWTSEEVLALWENFANGNGRFHSNVILNRLSDDDTSKWLRITGATGDVGEVLDLSGNYWGTTNIDLINKQILDFDDYQTLIDINEGKILTEAPETTFPFVVDAYLEVDGEEVDTVGNELVTFVVQFNRDMDTSIGLRVCFGSAYPYADYQVEGSYATPRQWRGTMKLSTIIENGYQYWSVSNGKAAGTSMKLYTDWGRFPFKIDTSSAQALIMQAEVTETGIQLTWEQDEFTTLAGYNVYRSTTEEGQYTKINRTVIPADTKEWFDDTVEPGQKYYYNFTVVESDMTESEPSGKVQATAMDTMAPNIYHSPVYHAFTGSNLVISATVTDNVAISSATLYYRTTGTEEWKSLEMTNNNDKYSAMISADEITVAGIEYYIDATDGITHTYKGTADAPYSITVQVAVADSEKGDVDGNGAVELKDALMLLMAINDRLNLTEDQFARADLDGNGELAAKEALRIMQYVNGTITSVLP